MFPTSEYQAKEINSSKQIATLAQDGSDVSEKNDSIFKYPKNIKELADQELLTTLQLQLPLLASEGARHDAAKSKNRES